MKRGDFGYRSAQRGSTRAPRVRLTDHQKRLRRHARSEGREAIRSLNRAMNPVYDGDEETWVNIAVAHARTAWRYAVRASEPPAVDASDPHATDSGNPSQRDKTSS